MAANPRQAPEQEDWTRVALRKLEEHRKTIVAVGTVAAITVVGLILFFTFRSKAEDERWTAFLNSPTNAPLETLREQAGPDLQPHLLMNLAMRQANDRDFEGALEALRELEDEFGSSFLAALPSPDRRFSLVGQFRRYLEAEARWTKEQVMETPEADVSRIALVETTSGSFWMGFYPGLAPEHVESFLSHAREGTFNGMGVTTITRSLLRMGGEHSRDADRTNDDDPETGSKLAAEPGRFRIPQERGAISSVATDDGESPTRFSVVVARTGAREIEKRQTVFACVLTDRHPGMTALDEIMNAPTFGNSTDEEIRNNPDFAEFPDHPVKPVRIERISVWSNGRIEDGHTWDVSRVVEPKEKAAVEESEDE